MPVMEDPYRLQRFVTAQDRVYETVLAELRAGRKRTHWMWFIFPQVAGLGSSWMAQEYAIHSRAEAQAYLAHPLLGERLRECTQLVAAHKERSLRHILGYPDDLKFRSSMTLFGEVAGAESVFEEALALHCSGERDLLTLERLGESHR
jgi:uncharacterized protein (DUF1810 family)